MQDSNASLALKAPPPFTRYPTGSIRELLFLSLPLMLSSLSGTVMLFLDRCFLAHYRIEAMNAAATACTLFAIISYSLVSTACISEVFVGQYHGAKQTTVLARPVWQMIWFSVFSFLVCWPLASLSPFLLPPSLQEEGRLFISWLAYFGPLMPLNAALDAFYIGRGKVVFITGVIVFTCLLNALLDIGLIFGWGPFPGLGTAGAAIATGLAQAVRTVIVGIDFLRPQHRKEFHTHCFALDIPLLKKMLNIAIPNALGHAFTLTAWASLMYFLAELSFEHITLFGFLQTLWLFVTFITDGHQKAVSTLSAHLIGAKAYSLIPTVCRSGMLLQCFYTGLLGIPLLCFVEKGVTYLLSNDPTISSTLILMIVEGCKWVLLAFFFDGLVWVMGGILLASGDTRFIMLVSAFNSWILGFLVLYTTFVLHAPPITSVYMIIGYTFMNLICFWFRYRQKKWVSSSFLSSEKGEMATNRPAFQQKSL